MIRPRHTLSRGFTVIETVVVIGIFLVIITSVISSINFFYRANRHAIEQTFAIDSARKGIERLVHDIREATYSDEGAYPVVAFGDNTFTFYSDIDADIYIEKVRYFLDDGFLKKGVVHASGDPLAYDDGNEIISNISDNVRNGVEGVPVFLYFDAAGDQILNTASTTAVAFVKVNLIVNTNPAQSADDFALRSSATLRNVRINQ